METVEGRWWNGRWGRMARRDVWLKRIETWRVEWRQGDGDSEVQGHDYPSAEDAKGMVDRLLGSEPAEWRDLTEVAGRGPSPDESSG